MLDCGLEQAGDRSKRILGHGEQQPIATQIKIVLDVSMPGNPGDGQAKEQGEVNDGASHGKYAGIIAQGSDIVQWRK